MKGKENMGNPLKPKKTDTATTNSETRSSSTVATENISSADSGEKGDEPKTIGALFFRVWKNVYDQRPFIAIGIAIVGVGIFGIEKYVQVMADAKKEAQGYAAKVTEAEGRANRMYEQKLQIAESNLNQTYITVASMSRTMIDNASTLSKLQQDVASNIDNLRAKQQKADEMRIQAETNAAYHLKKEEEYATKESTAQEKYEASEKKSREYDRELSKKRIQTADMEEESKKLQKAYEELVIKTVEAESKFTNLNKRIDIRFDQITMLKSNLQQLAEAVINSERGEKEHAVEYARDALNKLVDNPAQWLSLYATNPTANTITKLQNLIGASQEVVISNLASTPGFEGWIKLFKQNADGRETYIGVSKQTDWHWENVISLSAENGKISNVEVAYWFGFVHAPSVDNWFVSGIYCLAEPYSGEISQILSDKTFWRLVDQYKRATPVSGRVRLPTPMSPQEFQRHLAEIPRNVLTNGSVGDLVGMLANARDFKTNAFDLSPIKAAPMELQNQFLALVNSSVRWNNAKIVKEEFLPQKSDPELAGHLTAYVLRPGFTLVEVYATETGPQTNGVIPISIVDKRRPPMNSTANQYTIVMRLSANKRDTFADAEFEKGANGKWLLTDFMEPVTHVNGF